MFADLWIPCFSPQPVSLLFISPQHLYSSVLRRVQWRWCCAGACFHEFYYGSYFLLSLPLEHSKLLRWPAVYWLSICQTAIVFNGEVFHAQELMREFIYLQNVALWRRLIVFSNLNYLDIAEVDVFDCMTRGYWRK